jgi:hypothetical protein
MKQSDLFGPASDGRLNCRDDVGFWKAVPAGVQAVSEVYVTRFLPWDQITIDPDLQGMGHVDPNYIATLILAIRDNEQLPGPTPRVFKTDRGHVLADGHQKLAAFKAAGRDGMVVELSDGDDQAALEHAITANAKSRRKMPRDAEAKRLAVLACFNDPTLRHYSQRKLAKIVGVSIDFVLNRSKEFIAGELAKGHEVLTVKTGMDGKQHPTKKKTKIPADQSSPDLFTNSDPVGKAGQILAKALSPQGLPAFVRLVESNPDDFAFGPAAAIAAKVEVALNILRDLATVLANTSPPAD